MKIGDREIGERRLFERGEQRDKMSARGTGGLHAAWRILEDDAVLRREPEPGSGLEHDLRMWFGTRGLVAIDNHAETAGQTGVRQDELSVEGFGVRGQRAGDAGFMGAANEFNGAGDNIPGKNGGHQFAIQPLLGRAVGRDGILVQFLAEQRADDVVVPLAKHGLHDAFAGHAVRLKVPFPSDSVHGRGSNENSVHVENEPQSRGQLQFFAHSRAMIA